MTQNKLNVVDISDKIKNKFINSVVNVSSIYTDDEPEESRDISKKINQRAIGTVIDQWLSNQIKNYNHGKGADSTLYNIPLEFKSMYIDASSSSTVTVGSVSEHAKSVLTMQDFDLILAKLQFVIVVKYDTIKVQTQTANGITEEIVKNNHVKIVDFEFINLTSAEIQDELKTSISKALDLYYKPKTKTEIDKEVFEFKLSSDTENPKKWLRIQPGSKSNNDYGIYFEKETASSRISVKMSARYLEKLHLRVKNTANIEAVL